MSGWFGDGLERWWAARRHRGDAVACPLCDRAFDAWADGGRCWRCGGRERHRAAWRVLAARPELLRDAERVVHFAPQYGLRNRIARESGFEYVTADPDPSRANVVPEVLAPATFDGAVVTEPEVDAAAVRRVLRPGAWLVSVAPGSEEAELAFPA